MRNIIPIILLAAIGCSDSGSGNRPAAGSPTAPAFPPPPSAFPSSAGQPPGTPTGDDSIGDVPPNHSLGNQIAQAEGNLARQEKRQADLKQLFDKAQAERDELLSRLREMGVRSSTDLNGNPQAKQLNDDLQKVVRKIELLERDITGFTKAITQTKSLILFLERERILEGAKDDSAQVAEEERRRDDELGGNPDPIQQDIVLEQELSKPVTGTGRLPPSRPASLAEQLVGKWQVLGRTKATVEFARSTAILDLDHLRDALGRPLVYIFWGPTFMTYTVAGNSLTLELRRERCEVKIDVISDDEMIFVNDRGRRSMEESCGWLHGRLKRVKGVIKGVRPRPLARARIVSRSGSSKVTIQASLDGTSTRTVDAGLTVTLIQQSPHRDRVRIRDEDGNVLGWAGRDQLEPLGPAQE